MGEAKRRGTFEQRVTQAKERAVKKAEALNPLLEEQRKQRILERKTTQK